MYYSFCDDDTMVIFSLSFYLLEVHTDIMAEFALKYSKNEKIRGGGSYDW